jgi:serine protease Do
MRKSLTVAVMAAATLLAGGATATASETPSPSTESNASSAPESATPLERVRAYTQPSIVYIETTWTGYVYDTYNKLYLNDGNPITTGGGCTGFVLTEDGYIGTAGHCVNTPESGEPAIYEKAAQWALETGYYTSSGLDIDTILGFNDYVIQSQDGRRAKPQMKVTVAWAESAGGVETSKGLPARVVKWQKFAQGDGAILKVEESGLNSLPLAESDIEVGTDVISVGYPGSVDTVADPDFSPSFKEGSVSSQKTMSGGLTTVYEISAAMSGGMSGGPTVNLDGEVVGVNSFGPAAETQQFNFIQPVSVIRELLGDAGTENVLSEDTQAYRAGLDAYFDGDKKAAVENLETVVDNQPTNQLAKEYLDKSQELPDPPAEDAGSDSDGSNMGMIIGIVVGVLVLLAILGAVLLAMSRKKKGGSAATGGHAYGGPPAPGYQGYQQPGGTGAAPGATSTAVLTPTALQPGPSAAAPSQSPSTPPPPAPAPAPVAAAPAPAPTPAPEVVDETTFCQNCGTKGDQGQKFCKHCGTAL